MNNQTDNTQNTAEEFRQAVKRLGDGAAYVAREVPWVAIAKGTGKLAINILRYSMGLSIYGFIIWPYRFLVAPTCAVAAGGASTPVEDDNDVDWFRDKQDYQDYNGYFDPATNEDSAIRTPGNMTFDGQIVGADGKLYRL